MKNSHKAYLAGIVAFVLLVIVFAIGPRQIQYTLAGITMEPASEMEKGISEAETRIDARVIREKSNQKLIEKAIERLTICLEIMKGGDITSTKRETDLIYCHKFSQLKQSDGNDILDPEAMDQAILRYLTVGLGFERTNAERTVFQW